jgi:hypothetical protein
MNVLIFYGIRLNRFIGKKSMNDLLLSDMFPFLSSSLARNQDITVPHPRHSHTHSVPPPP